MSRRHETGERRRDRGARRRAGARRCARRRRAGRGRARRRQDDVRARRLPGARGDGAVTSPTFTIGQRYPAPVPVSHLDLYRVGDLGDEDPELLADYLGPDTIAFVEWPEARDEAGSRRCARIAAAGRGSTHAGGDRRTVEIEREDPRVRHRDRGDGGRAVRRRTPAWRSRRATIPPPGERPRHAPADAADRRGARAGRRRLGELDRIAVGVGPGTFTGLRIGDRHRARAGQARGIPLVGVSTLQSLALSARRAARPRPPVPTPCSPCSTPAAARCSRPPGGSPSASGSAAQLLAAAALAPERARRAGRRARPGRRWRSETGR